MSKSFRQFKKGDFGLREAKASTTHLQYLRAKQAGNNHFEVRRYIADKILNDRKLADAYKSLETIHDTYGRHIGCLLYTSPSPRDLSTSRMPSSA